MLVMIKLFDTMYLLKRNTPTSENIMIRIQRANKIIEVNVELKSRDCEASKDEPSISCAYDRDRIRNAVRVIMVKGGTLEDAVYNGQKVSTFKADNKALATHFYKYEAA